MNPTNEILQGPLLYRYCNLLYTLEYRIFSLLKNKPNTYFDNQIYVQTFKALPKETWVSSSRQTSQKLVE